jgi:hypothetical protein
MRKVVLHGLHISTKSNILKSVSQGRKSIPKKGDKRKKKNKKPLKPQGRGNKNDEQDSLQLIVV